MMRRGRFITQCVCALCIVFGTGCGPGKTGSLVFRANGEDFVRRGFVDKQGWSIRFDHLFVNLTGITAYNARDKLRAVLPGEHLVDLAAGDENAEPIRVGLIDKTPAGNYRSLAFRVARVSSGEHAGCSIVMTGTAEKGGKTVPFTIRLDEEMTFDGTEGYVGDEVKGIVRHNDTADVEMTFHFDHIFGDIEAEADDHINTGSVGFDFFLQFAEHDRVRVDQSRMKQAGEYTTLVRSLWTLGHLGEGHCGVSGTSTRL